ncbi:hypothetical protein SLS58_001858 [Diplodia intermedia]|uniref:Amine oxidase domain-containing protein n=1 Tax=Diplodia intermedia TaxID=856260 RepID=A0ABR3U1T8_9PEZI
MSLPLIRRVLPVGGRKPHVCVVGAGVSGLRCTITHNWDGRQGIFDSKGSQLSEKEAAEASETIWSIIGDGMEFSKQNSASIPPTKSLLDYIHEKTKELYTDENWNHLQEAEKEKKRHLLHDIAEMWGAFVGSPAESQSLRFFWLEECIDGENLFVAETYHKILERIAKPALEGADVKFNQRVKTVETVAEEGNENGAVKVHLDDGKSMLFDEVVMTTPLGWLKRNKDTAFSPPLPERLSDAIDSIGYGCLDKFYITFPTAFWDAPSPPPSATSPVPTSARQTIPNTTATTAPVHQPDPTAAAEGSSPRHYPGFAQWTSPLYAAPTNPDRWSQECVNMAALPGPTAHPTLLFYTFGPTSQHLASLLLLKEDDDDDNQQKRLLSFFAPYYTRLPNFDPADPAHRPSSVLATAWTNDELAGYGSYCNFQTGLERGDADVEAMRRGLPERRVWFAGEHTASFLALGTVTGAYWSGEGVGRGIAWAYGCGGKGGGVAKE